MKKILNIVVFIFVIELLFPHKLAFAAPEEVEAVTGTSVVLVRTVVLVPDPRFEPGITNEQVDSASWTAFNEEITLPANTEVPVVRQYLVTTTAYASVPEQTDGDPFTMADGTRVYDGAIAANFLKFGTKVRFPDLYGDKVFEVHDRMNARYNGKHIVDIWHADNADAKKFGAKYNLVMEVLED